MRTSALTALFLVGCGSVPESRGPAGDDRPLAIEVGDRPVDLAAGDLDGDGALDLVTINAGDHTVGARLQRAGAWVAAPGTPPRVDPSSHLVALADVDNDRDLDLLTTAHDSGAVAIWLGDGTGRFSAAPGSPVLAVASERPHNHGLATGDLDDDGDADIVVSDQNAQVAAVLLGDGTGRFIRGPGSPFALGGHPYPLALGYVDGDKALDLVAPLVDDGAIAVLLGNGKGSFAPAAGSPHPTGLPRPYGITLADLDRDGALDVAAAHDDSNQVTVWLGDGRGRLRAGSRIDLGLRLWRMSAADLDRDGDIDLVGAGSGSIAVVPGDGKGGLGAPRLEKLGEGWTAIVADLDGDGILDIAAPDSDADVVRVWLRAIVAP